MRAVGLLPTRDETDVLQGNAETLKVNTFLKFVLEGTRVIEGKKQP